MSKHSRVEYDYMNKRRSTVNRIICGFLAALVMLLPIIALLPAQVSAAGETWKWKDNQTVTVTGGDANGTLKQNAVVGTILYGNLVYQNKCQIRIQLTPSQDGKSGTVFASGTTEASDGTSNSKPSCAAVDEDGNALFDGVINQYNNKTVDLGDRPTDAEERDDQKTVTVTVNSPDPASDSPGAVTITMKDGNGKNVEEPNEVPQQTPSWEGEGVPERRC